MHFLRPLFFCLLILQWSGWVPVGAQELPPANQQVTAHAFLTGVHRYEPGKWAAVGLRVANFGDEPIEKSVALYGEEELRMQYGRTMWLPAQSTRVLDVSFHVPTDIPQDRSGLDLQLLSFDHTRTDEVLSRRSYDQMVTHSLLPLDFSRLKTAAIYHDLLLDESASTLAKDDAAYQLIQASKKTFDGSPIVIELSSDFLPHSTAAYDGLDQLIICSDRIRSDTAGLLAIRRWLQQGGRVWVMLDRVGPETLVALLGNGTCCEIVGRTELTDFTICDTTQVSEQLSQETWQADDPASFLEVMTDEKDIHCTIDGWPAAFWKRVGLGEVLITTLGPEGWVAKFNPFAEGAVPQNQPVGPLLALQSISARFYQPRTVQPATLKPYRPILLEQIGRSVPSRRLALATLVGSCLGMLLAGIWLHHIQRQWHMVWLVPTFCLMAAAIMFTVGAMASREVPASLAYLQLVQAVPETESADCRSLLAFYSESTRELPLPAGADVLMEPDVTDLDGIIKRVTWDDNGHSNWRNISVKPRTVRFVEMRAPLAEGQTLRAHGRFGPRGFSGNLEGELVRGLKDGLIASAAAPELALDIEADGSFLGGQGQVLPPNQFLKSAMLTDEQRRHLEGYRALLDAQSEGHYPPQLTLLGWRGAEPLDDALCEGFRTIGAMLVAIPLEIELSHPGDSFLVPATFIDVHVVEGETGLSMAFDQRLGKWVEGYSFATNSRLRYVLPRQVLPCRLSRAVVSLKADVPSRTLRISGVADGGLSVLFERSNFNGVAQFEIEDASLLELDEFGGLLLNVEVTDTDRPQESVSTANRERQAWQIDYLHLEVEGQTVDEQVAADDASP
jgi:hypothetical protein